MCLKGQQVPEQDIPHKFSSNTGTQPWASIYRLPKGTPNPLTSHNSLLDTSLHSRGKKSSSTHQNTDTSFPNQETLTSPPQWGNSTKFTTLVFANVYFISYEHSSCLSFKRQIHFLSPSIRSGLPWKASQSGLKQTLQLVASLKHWTGEQLPSVRPRPARAEQAGREPPDGAFSASLCPPPQSSSAFEQ